MDLYLENGGVAPTLRSPRLTLRQQTHADGDVACRVFRDHDVVRWLTGVPFPYAASDFAWFLDSFIPDTHHLVWAIDAGDGMIGCIGVQPELGYWLDPAHHGQGLMTEAATCVLDWYFARSDIDLTSGYHLGNGPSSAVLRKLGFTDTHINRDVKTARGDTVDIQRLALSRADWQARRG